MFEISKEVRKDIENHLGISYEEISDLEFEQEELLLKMNIIKKKTGMSYNEFLQLDVLEQMRLDKILNFDTPSEKHKKEFDKNFDDSLRKSKLEDKRLKREIIKYEIIKSAKKLIKK